MNDIFKYLWKTFRYILIGSIENEIRSDTYHHFFYFKHGNFNVCSLSPFFITTLQSNWRSVCNVWIEIAEYAWTKKNEVLRKHLYENERKKGKGQKGGGKRRRREENSGQRTLFCIDDISFFWNLRSEIYSFLEHRAT